MSCRQCQTQANLASRALRELARTKLKLDASQQMVAALAVELPPVIRRQVFQARDARLRLQAKRAPRNPRATPALEALDDNGTVH